MWRRRIEDMDDDELTHSYEAWQGSMDVEREGSAGWSRFMRIDREMSERGLLKRILSQVCPGRGRHGVGE